MLRWMQNSTRFLIFWGLSNGEIHKKFDRRYDMAHVLSKNLRNAVLQAAIEGKLTSIDKALIEYDDTLFSLPFDWKWTTIGNVIFSTEAGKSPNCVNRQANDNEWGVIKTTAIQPGYFLPSENKVLPASFEIKENYIVRPGDLLITRAGPRNRTGVMCIVDCDCKKLILSDKTIRFNINRTVVLPKFIILALNSPFGKKEIEKYMVGMASSQVNISQNSMKLFRIPLPPIEEQARIVARVDELMAEIDEYEKIENQLVELKKNFPGDMKAAVLQAAMQGKLTEQLESDSNVFEYMRNVISLKNELIKKKEIKKDKTADSIDNEIPFDIPDNWSWVKFGNIATLRPGKTPPRAEPIWWGKTDEIPWVSIADMVSDGTVTKTKEFISKAGFEQKFNGTISPAGTMIMSFKLTIGRMSILGMDALHNEAIISIFPFIDEDKTLQKYLFKVLPYLTQYGDSKNAIKGNTLNADSLCNLYIPLPPIEEQRRIVEKLDQLLPLCKELEKEIA